MVKTLGSVLPGNIVRFWLVPAFFNHLNTVNLKIFPKHGGICYKENSTKVLKIKLWPVYTNTKGRIYTSYRCSFLVSLYMYFKWSQRLRIFSFKQEGVPHSLNISWNKCFVRNFCRKTFCTVAEKGVNLQN